MTDDCKKIIRDGVLLAGASFSRAVFSGPRNETMFVKVVVRPVEIKGVRQVQFSYLDKEKDITKNYSNDEVAASLDELLDLPFRNIRVETSNGDLDVHISKKGRHSVTRSRSAGNAAVVDLSHDRKKQRILDSSAPFLQAVGITTSDSKIKASMNDKFRQINEFVRLMAETNVLKEFAGKPVRVVDFGCGNAHLTFATCHYLNNILGLEAHICGIDVKANLLAKHREHAKALGWDRLTFQQAEIAEFQPDYVPDIVMALHACDTATDDALAFAIRRGAKIVLCAPCCQHELQSQLAQTGMPAQLEAISRFGILRERMGDILTDTFRATILRIDGYRTDVVQFVSSEHTAKNLMIRAVKTASQNDMRTSEEYRALKAFWNTTPYLEHLLRDAGFSLESGGSSGDVFLQRTI